MNFLKKLFAKGEEPLSVYDDPVLGRTEWSADDEAWIGAYQQVRFALAYDREARPTPRLLSYARDVLGDPAWLSSTLEEEKALAAKSSPDLRSEIAGLKLGLVHFAISKGREYIIASVEGGNDPRCWRIEYHGRKCDGLGFDT
ncbi:MAG TPA: hypothetical protein VG734_22930 [Lacunisphaera sp.]|nr:hypothetical protein [Lacunisphaera sp.]